MNWNKLPWSLVYSFLCVSAKFHPISASFIPVRREGRKKGKTETAVNNRLWSRSIISWNIASIHILPPPGYAQMHCLSFRARQTKIQAFLKLWASAETPQTFSKRSNSCWSRKNVPYGNRCSPKDLSRRRKFKPDEGTEGKFDTFNARPWCRIFALPSTSQKSSRIKISELQAHVSSLLDFRLFRKYIKIFLMAIYPVSWRIGNCKSLSSSLHAGVPATRKERLPIFENFFRTLMKASFWEGFRTFGAGPQLKESRISVYLARKDGVHLAEAKCESRRYFRK